MKKRMFLSGLIAGAIVAGATTAFAADYIKAALYPVQLIINGEKQDLSEEYAILNYDDDAYVPLRLVAERLGAEVGYIHGSSYEDTQITIDLPQGWEGEEAGNNPIPSGLVYHVGIGNYFNWIRKTEEVTLAHFQEAFELTDLDVELIVKYYEVWGLPPIPPEYHVFDHAAYTIPDYLISHVGLAEFEAWTQTDGRLDLAGFQQYFGLTDEKVREVEYQTLKERSPSALGQSKGFNVKEYGQSSPTIEKQLRELLANPPQGTEFAQKSSEPEWLNTVVENEGVVVVDFNEEMVQQLGPLYIIDYQKLHNLLNDVVFSDSRVEKVYYQINGSYADWGFWFWFGEDGVTREEANQ
ncbi:hypothetical protein [Paenibacillus sp. J2TS4]|uniref:hypothetical protein n=1 Tax=Paenibacillus sp. J2TS4 TaxID=2807194 RepID=UPI001B0E2EAD|nr:hypothetical protein [Paenibacillus sp. J2TS4]GIP33345.1 hypothetical protein J2TS4_25550 [Paenibacillus sp. J2TS4]